MPTLLAIEVSPRHEFSTSRKLTAHFIDQWKAAHPGAAVVVRDLIEDAPAVRRSCLDRRRLYSARAAFAGKRRRHQDLERTRRRVKAADQIVIGTPMFGCSIPAVLKA